MRSNEAGGLCHKYKYFREKFLEEQKELKKSCILFSPSIIIIGKAAHFGLQPSLEDSARFVYF
jgi:hypothetical protein